MFIRAAYGIPILKDLTRGVVPTGDWELLSVFFFPSLRIHGDDKAAN